MSVAAVKQDCIRFVISEDAGSPCWYYVRVPADKLSAFDAASASAGFDPRVYGTIIESNLGEYPTQDVIAFMEQEYGFITQ